MVYLILVTSLLYLGFSQWGNDDPYITYRYAKNLAAGQGFVYNSGDRVLSTTTPLFTLLLVVVTPVWEKLTSSSMPQLANMIGAFSLALGGFFLWSYADRGAKSELTRAEGQSWVGWTGLILYPIFPLLVSSLGSEIPLYLAFCLGALAFYGQRSYRLTAIMAALAVLTRPDGFLLGGILLLDYLSQPGKAPFPWLAGLIFTGLVLPWFVFAWGYFGTPLPATLAAKQHQGMMAISQRFAPGLLTILRQYLLEWFFWFQAALGVVGLFWLVQKGRFKSWRLVYFWTGLYFGAYTLLGVSRYYWYYAPMVPGFLILVGLGVTAFGSVFENRSGRFWPGQITTGLQTIWLPAGMIALLAIGQVVRLNQMRRIPDPRLAVYRAVGEWLNKNTPADAAVGALEVGIIGYYSERPMIDFAGLVQPEIATRLGKETTYADSALWAAAHYQPATLVIQEGLFPALETGYISQYCGFVKQFPGEPFGYPYNLNIYHCFG